jgi:hypothetical protein
MDCPASSCICYFADNCHRDLCELCRVPFALTGKNHVRQPATAKFGKGFAPLLSKIDRNRTRECEFKRFGGRCRLLFENHPRQDPVEVRCDRQQKQITQKAAEIAKGLGMNRASTGCKTKFTPARQRAPASRWLII